MVQSMAPRSFVDTHVIVWLLAGKSGLLSARASGLLTSDQAVVSPMVRLELQFMHEIGRLTSPADEVLAEAYRQLGITVEDRSLAQLVEPALALMWTRDPFDRLIVAQAALDSAPLITRDRLIRQHYEHAVW